ncbi:MAG TPA: bifunctional nicotinamide-nucleotide adenylyltransferase/Nudix hydroxylase [Gallionella sp.]|nr:bifunctional nicotinamide-nucleotide adenylyltransferase/Nudix hydroxylase [Gallionella sp.]
MVKEFDYLVYIGRFQPLHNGHLDVLRRALDKADKVVVVTGSGRRARNIKNPFSDSERAQMIAASVKAMDESAAERLVFCPVRDYYNNDKWVAAVKKAVAGIAGADAAIGIIGHLKDASSYYLHEFPDWRLVHEENVDGLNATDLRQCLFSETSDPKAWERLAHAVPPAVLAFLKDFRESPPFADLAGEFAAVEKSRATWAVAPYPPVFVTVDAVVRCNGHVLLIRRGGYPGRGQWALPGGFVEQDERLQDAAIRELAEETGCALRYDALRNAIAGLAVFDDPNRSVRGRTITHAFFFDLGTRAFPAVAAADDAAEARWFPVASLRDMETDIFEDHLHIMDSFLKIL